MVADAAFLSGLRKVKTELAGEAQEAWRPKYVFHYLQDRFLQPDFVVDISDHMEKKIESVLCYTTQFFNPELNEPQTYISSPEFLETVKSRAMMLGKRVGVRYAEGYISEKMLGVKSLDAFIQQNT